VVSDSPYTYIFSEDTCWMSAIPAEILARAELFNTKYTLGPTVTPNPSETQDRYLFGHGLKSKGFCEFAKYNTCLSGQVHNARFDQSPDPRIDKLSS
jgi:hypothetical protein